jgi:hypothetical protein
MGSHVFSLNRMPQGMTSIGDYYVGDVDCVALCGQMLMMHEDSPFASPDVYNPRRFLSKKPEPKTSKDIVTFGSGLHLCPGRLFAIMEAKMLAAVLTNHFELPSIVSQGKLDYFSPSAYAERAVKFKLTPIANPLENLSKTVVHKGNIDDAGHEITVRKLAGGRAYLVRGMFENSEAEKRMYEQVVGLVENPQDISKPITTLAYENLVYTNTSNCCAPFSFYDLSNRLWNYLRSVEELEFKENDIVFESFYSQLFNLSAKMQRHKDAFVNWGVSYSFGASCEFTLGSTTLTLNSGDILVAPFGEIEHSVDSIVDNAPGWWDTCVTHGFNRCSIQVRQKVVNPSTVTESDFFALVGN